MKHLLFLIMPFILLGSCFGMEKEEKIEDKQRRITEVTPLSQKALQAVVKNIYSDWLLKKDSSDELEKALNTLPLDLITPMLQEPIDADRNTLLLKAAEMGLEKQFTTLMNAGAALDATNQKNETVLILLAGNNHFDILKSVIDYAKNHKITINLNTHDRYKMTPLHFAAEYGNIPAINALIKAGAAVNAQNYLGASPLIKAVYKGQLEAVKALIKTGAEVNAQDLSGDSPLHIAGYKGQLEAVRALVKARADVNAQNLSLGFSPLHVAAQNGRLAVVKALIEAGADKKITDNWGKTALDIARDNGHSTIVEILESE